MYLLGYDIGTSSVKAAIVDAATGRTMASDFFPKQEAPIKALKSGWAEQDPEAWWTYVKEVTRAVMDASGVDKTAIKAIGFSFQMHGLVVVDKDRRPLRDAIIWCDSRAVSYGERAFKEIGEQKCLTSLLNSPGNFTAAKLAWVKENEPEVYERIYKVMLPADYIAMKMTGEIVTTPEGLSNYVLWDFKANHAAGFLMDYFGFDGSILPDVVPTFSEQGKLTAEAAQELGLHEGIPVTYRAGDQPNNAVSLNVFNPGEIASTAGTSGVVYGINGMAQHDELSRVNNFAHVNHTAESPRIGVLACINGTGILNSWMKRNVAPAGTSYDEMNTLAASVPVGSEGVSILPFGNGAERLLENRQTGCSIHGVNFNVHNRNHLLRAAQEGIVFALMYGIEIMQSMGLPVNRIHAAHANMFMSPVFRLTLASVSGAEIVLFDTDGAAGAAKAAGIGAGIYKDNTEAFGNLEKLGEVMPATDRSPYLEAYARWKSHLLKEA